MHETLLKRMTSFVRERIRQRHVKPERVLQTSNTTLVFVIAGRFAFVAIQPAQQPPQRRLPTMNPVLKERAEARTFGKWGWSGPLCFLVAGSVFLVGSLGSLAAQETIDLETIVRGLVDGVPPLETSWEVETVISPLPALAAERRRTQQERYSNVKDPKKLQRLLEVDNAIIAARESGETVPLAIEAKILRKDRYVVHEHFVATGARLDFHAGAENAFYVVKENERSIRVLKDQEEQLLFELGRGVPAYYLNYFLAMITGVKLVEDSEDRVIVEGDVRGQGFLAIELVELVKANFGINSIRLGYRVPSKAASEDAQAPLRDVVLSEYTVLEPAKLDSSGLAVPKKVRVVDYDDKGIPRIVETWTLKSASLVEASDVPVYKIKHGYRIRDERGDVPILFSSDELLGPPETDK